MAVTSEERTWGSFRSAQRRGCCSANIWESMRTQSSSTAASSGPCSAFNAAKACSSHPLRAYHTGDSGKVATSSNNPALSTASTTSAKVGE